MLSDATVLVSSNEDALLSDLVSNTIEEQGDDFADDRRSDYPTG